MRKENIYQELYEAHLIKYLIYKKKKIMLRTCFIYKLSTHIRVLFLWIKNY